MNISEAEEFLQERIPIGEEFVDREISNSSELKKLDKEAERWGSYNEEWIKIRLGYSEYLTYHLARTHSTPDFASAGRFEFGYYRRHIIEQISKLESIRERLPLWATEQRATEQQAAEQRAAEQQATEQRAAERQARPSPNAPIFIVHGTDTGRAQLVARAVERATRREVVILREQPSGGRTLIEKFEDHAQEAAFAVVVITADDTGGPANGSIRPRGRQNVIFEMGYFYGQIGRNNVCVLLDKDVEQPSDMSGIVYINFDEDGLWKQELFREMHHAGFQIDWPRIP